MLFILLIAAIVAGDQIAKYFAQSVLTELPGMTYTFIPGFINFTYAENTGAAFSMLNSATWLLAIASGAMAVVFTVILFKYRRVDSWLFKISLCFIVGGAIGNLIDRVFRGFVVDMLEFDFVNFAIFNVADSFVTIGAVMLGIYIIWFWGKHKDEEKIEDVPGND